MSKKKVINVKEANGMDIEGNAVIKEEATRFFIQLLGGNVDTSNSEARRNLLESLPMIPHHIIVLTNISIVDPYLPLDFVEEIIDNAFDLGLSMVDNFQNMERNILSMIVKIRVLFIVPSIDRDEEEEIASIRSATKSSIEVLKKVTLKLDDSCSKRECAICLETFCAGLEVTRMPCSHMFHGNCIARWLEKSSLCPLCRFAMPVH
ncbi:unnamed protein product [Ilex paraguariensis]|uniref:RING-type domain-containing protein n=1 Tax=Ilex paraguariensis TaxID=185542 RepID=A0ABC8TH78_9AQUA